MEWKAKWIKSEQNMGEVCPLFFKTFHLEKEVRCASLSVTALGVYEASINGNRVGKFIMAPGWTSYNNRLQYQVYDVTWMLEKENELIVTVGKGWYHGRIGWEESNLLKSWRSQPEGIIAQLEIEFMDGSDQIILSDDSWMCEESKVRFSEIYDGEIYDASFEAEQKCNAVLFDGPTDTLVPQQGEDVIEQEIIEVYNIFRTPKNELVIDFGQEITGYVEINVTAHEGETVELSHAEVMDQAGNFYTENYRTAKAKYKYICKKGRQSYKPKHTFYGFRYVRVDQFPGGIEMAKESNFKAIAVHSDIKRTGYFSSSNETLNQLYHNVIWGQKGNFLDVPTDCPQRDERLGWTGDAQVFIKTAAYNYDVKRFFEKWLTDLALDQRADGAVWHVVPNILDMESGNGWGERSGAAWGDAATICPWELYMAYGDVEILKNQFTSMKKWVDYITGKTTTQYLWTGGTHYGDWLGLDAPVGEYKGASRDDFIASAFYARSTHLVVKTGTVLGEDIDRYAKLYNNIRKKFNETYPEYTTQTECILAVQFHLTDEPKKAANQLADMIVKCGNQLMTGFVGTPYLLHVLSDYGYTDLAYSLLLREEYPSWLYSVSKGATTIWEHWDSIMEDGQFWSSDMNSFNHYAYGSVADWIYGFAAGIQPVEEYPGYEKVKIYPHPDKRIHWMKTALETKYGRIESNWYMKQNKWIYEIVTPVDAMIQIAEKTMKVPAGNYVFYETVQ